MEALTSAYLSKNLTYTNYWTNPRVGYLSSNDIAAVAAKVLVDEPQRHAGKDDWLSVESHSGKEIAQLMSEVTGLEIKCEEKGVEEFKQLIEAWISKGADSWYATANIEFVTQMLIGRMSYMSMVRNDIPYIR